MTPINQQNSSHCSDIFIHTSRLNRIFQTLAPIELHQYFAHYLTLALHRNRAKIQNLENNLKAKVYIQQICIGTCIRCGKTGTRSDRGVALLCALGCHAIYSGYLSVAYGHGWTVALALALV